MDRKLIFGLGNPGRQYEHTRHNVGEHVVRHVARRQRALWKFDHLREGLVHAQARGRSPVRLVIPLIRVDEADPLTMRGAAPWMMNELGHVLEAAMKLWPVEREHLLLVCEDVNLPLGTLRLRTSGSDGGHHGLASCLQTLGTQAVARLRIGVGIEPLPRDLTEFVLSPFGTAEQPAIEQAVARAADGCEWWINEGIASAMTRVNSQPE